MKGILLTLLMSSLLYLAGAQTTIYTNDMDYVIGDVKQAFITGQVTEASQVFNLLSGFETMQVNGIRIPIFPEGTDYDDELLEFFVSQARLKGFDIFANPAQDAGGKRIANKTLLSADQVAVKDDAEKRQVLIDRIILANETYDLKWINPFNEDSKTGSIWSVNDMNVIYSTLSAELKDVELIGSCAWGIPASIDIFEKTNIKDYVTVSTTHNLGFNHTDWTEFIQLSHDAGLPVWDSEVNHTKKFEDRSTRLEAAIEYGVDGLVLYNSYTFIAMSGDGSISDVGQTWMDLYLKDESSIGDTPDADLFSHFCFNNTITLTFNDPNNITSVVLNDISGRSVIVSNTISETTLDIPNLKSGVYVLSVQSSNGIQSEKLIVQ